MEGALEQPALATVPVAPELISDALASAYIKLDYDICSAPLRLILNTPDVGTKTKSEVKSISEPACNGACAITVVVDEGRQEVHFASTGDARAVAGYYISPQTDSHGIRYQGGWKCEVLTEDHTANGPKEKKRYALSERLLYSPICIIVLKLAE
ncbi:hypothetical protein QFC19_001757 [Naganishia cerealis]|uniref:Uncharacterized protein n=1 Tax=Naganishia cerealis TaxID=610337 RepID=A0ACC2WG96_9TREE|nr:hypothetical protein QFC19_001757 [Naganishia cerealis]